MKVYDAAKIRNIAVVGHGGDGKTTLVESFLFDAGTIERKGRVEDGNTTTDFDPEEVKRGFSLTAGLAPVEWKGEKFNFIDTPGYFDFVGEATQAYALADSLLIVSNAAARLEVGAEKAFAAARRMKKPVSFIVNQMDREHAHFGKTVAQYREKFGSGITVVYMPIMIDSVFAGYINILENKAYMFEGKGVRECPIPEEFAEEVAAYRQNLVENAAASDEALLEKFFAGEELDQQDIFRGLKTCVASRDIFPVFVCSAEEDKCVRELMDGLISILPTAADAAPVQAQNAAGETVEVSVTDDGPFAGQVLKTIADQFVGRISLVKVRRGKITQTSPLYNVNAEKAEKFGNLTVMRGKNLIPVTEVCAGDIFALSKLQYSSTGDTLVDPAEKITFAPLKFDEPCLSLAVTAKKQGEEEKVFSGLYRLEDEDPTIRVSKNKETGDMLIHGMGEMHIEVICQKLKNKFGVEAALSEPKVAYRETIKKTAEAEGRHKKQSGGAGQYGVVQIRFEPADSPDADFEFVNAIVGGVVPKEFIPAVEKGLRESITHGVLAGYPMVGLKATLFDGKYHPVDSKEVAFKSAARLAYKAACAKAEPVLLEPIGSLKVFIPDEYMGDIIGDINRRRGRILGMHPYEEGQMVEAEVPQSEMVKYATDLRSMTQARGSFEIAFARYEEMPAQMAAKITEQAKKAAEE